MTIQSILAEKAVSVAELRKNPLQYFSDEPVVVLSLKHIHLADNRPWPVNYIQYRRTSDIHLVATELLRAIATFR